MRYVAVVLGELGPGGSGPSLGVREKLRNQTVVDSRKGSGCRSASWPG